MMIRVLIFFTALFFSCFFIAEAQNAPAPQATPPIEQTTDPDVVRITTNLVQIDAVVTDKDGNLVTNLNADDFELFQDGKPQKITNFSYVNTAASNQAAIAPGGKNNKNAAPQPPVKVRPENVGRLITFVVDDGTCGATHVGIFAAQEALVKFINEQMLPNDLVAIYRTRAGTSVFQQYTSDKEQLLRTARKIRWYPAAPGCSFGEDYLETPDQRRTRESAEDFARNNQIVGTIGVLRYVVNGLQKIGGRKVVFLLSDGIPTRARTGQFLTAIDALRDLTDEANRAAVVFNTIDVRGVYSNSVIEASDNVSTASNPNASDDLINSRAREDINRQDGLYILARETGGRFYRGSNFLDAPIRRALNAEKGYYLLAYQPNDETFRGKKFHDIDIRVRRPDLRVLSRAGFIGKTESEARRKPRTGDSELYEAIIAPLPRAGLELGLTAFFVNTAAEGNLVRALLHLNGEDIAFVNEADGKIKAVFDVVAVTLNEKNEVVDEFNRTHTFRIDAAALSLIKQNGLIYSTDVPVKKAGTYNLRVALRDGASRLLGSAGQVIQVPDLKKEKLFVSGLAASAVDAGGKFTMPTAVKPENALSLTGSTAVPAIRQFRRPSALAYSYQIYNAQIDKSGKQPKLSAKMNLYRNGKIIFEEQPQAISLEGQSDFARINNYGFLRLNQNVEPGEYVLQIVVTDEATKQTSSQWIDFEVL